jgi:hypothetical protein
MSNFIGKLAIQIDITDKDNILSAIDVLKKWADLLPEKTKEAEASTPAPSVPPPPPPPGPAQDHAAALDEKEKEGVDLGNVSLGADVDKFGVPWDKRIHASTKAMLKNGGWKKKRGITDEEYNEVLAEITAAAPAPAPAAQEPAQMPAADVTQAFNQEPAEVPPPPPPAAPAAPAAEVPPPPPPPAQTAEPVNFMDLTDKYLELKNNGILTPEIEKDLFQKMNIEKWVDVNADPERLNQVSNYLKALS